MSLCPQSQICLNAGKLVEKRDSRKTANEPNCFSIPQLERYEKFGWKIAFLAKISIWSWWNSTGEWYSSFIIIENQLEKTLRLNKEILLLSFTHKIFESIWIWVDYEITFNKVHCIQYPFVILTAFPYCTIRYNNPEYYFSLLFVQWPKRFFSSHIILWKHFSIGE